jgi:calcium-dependent protein kinase
MVMLIANLSITFLFSQVLKKKPDFKQKPWPTISASARDFVKKLLVKDPRVRMSAAQALCMCSF